MKKIFTLLAFLCTIIGVGQNLMSPSEFLGYELGTQFSRHHQVMDYYKYVSNTLANQVKLDTYGYTNELRPLVTAIISSAENIKNLEAIRNAHLDNAKGTSSPDKAIAPGNS